MVAFELISEGRDCDSCETIHLLTPPPDSPLLPPHFRSRPEVARCINHKRHAVHSL